MRALRWPLVAFLVGVMVVASSAQQPGGRQGGGRGGLTGQVATNVALQEELKLTEDQKAKAKAASEKMLAGLKDRGQAFKDAAGDKEKMQELFTKMQKDAEEVTKQVEAMLTPEQKTRLKQLEVQVAGVRAFSNDETVAALKLEDAQKTKIKSIVDEYSKDVRELGGFGGPGGKGGTFDKEKLAEAATKRAKLAKGAMADIDEVLNDAQRTTWKGMTGPAAADLDKLRGGFGGFGGGFGQPGGFGNKGKTQPKKMD